MIAASVASAGRPVALGADQRDVEEAQEHAERGGLRRDRHEGRDRRRRALVDVRRPLVERRDRGLEAEAGDAQRDAGQQQRVGREAGAEIAAAIALKSVAPVAP